MLLYEEQVFNPDSERTFLVVTGFVGHIHTRDQHHFRVTSDILRTLMAIEMVPNTMPGAMVIVETYLPERAASEEVKIGTCDARGGGPDGHLKVEVAHQHASVALLLAVSWGAEVAGASGVGGSVEVLPSGVA